jgi:hypothetical protein
MLEGLMPSRISQTLNLHFYRDPNVQDRSQGGRERAASRCERSVRRERSGTKRKCIYYFPRESQQFGVYRPKIPSDTGNPLAA